MPHSNAFCEENGIEEERRLCYVGITRAEKLLFMSSASSRMVFGNHISYPPSRFLKEIILSQKELLLLQNFLMIKEQN